MVKIPDNIKKIIDRYISLLKKNNISVENAYLFGSYAKGYNNEWSDIDLAIISGSFEGIRIKDRDKIRRITLSVSSNLEILPFNPLIDILSYTAFNFKPNDTQIVFHYEHRVETQSCYGFHNNMGENLSYSFPTGITYAQSLVCL